MDYDSREFAEIEVAAERLYKSVGMIFCPALKSEVHFTSDGFHHLKYDGSRSERPKSVQRNKMLCLAEAITVIGQTTTTQEYRCAVLPCGKPDRSGFRHTKTVTYYAFLAITDFDKPRRINVVVRRVGDGRLHFWSVMPYWKRFV